MFWRKKVYLNADHDPADYRVCGKLHPMRRFELPTANGVFIGYVCDICADVDDPCMLIPHFDRAEEGGGARWFDRPLDWFWIAVAWVTFGRIDRCRVYDQDADD